MSTVGPYQMVNSLRPTRCNFRSSMATQIHMAGMTCIRDRRQSENSSFTPSNSIRSAPTAKVRGAKIRFRWLSWRTAASTCDSSPSLITRTSWRTCAAIAARRLRRGLASPGFSSVVPAVATTLALQALGTGPHHGRQVQQPTLVLAPPGTT
jgi:hypothetical protein